MTDAFFTFAAVICLSILPTSASISLRSGAESVAVLLVVAVLAATVSTSGTSSILTDLVVVPEVEVDGDALGVAGGALVDGGVVVDEVWEGFRLGHCLVRCFPPQVQHLCVFSFSFPSQLCLKGHLEPRAHPL